MLLSSDRTLLLFAVSLRILGEAVPAQGISIPLDADAWPRSEGMSLGGVDCPQRHPVLQHVVRISTGRDAMESRGSRRRAFP